MAARVVAGIQLFRYEVQTLGKESLNPVLMDRRKDLVKYYYYDEEPQEFHMFVGWLKWTSTA